MKKTPVHLLLSAVALSCAFFISCQKDVSDPSLISEARGGNGNGNAYGHNKGGSSAGTSTRTCYLGQGYWFGSGKHAWPDINGGTVTGSITISGPTNTYYYTQEQGLAIWKSSNAGGMKDAKKAFVLLATIQLSAATISNTYAQYNADITTVSSWLASLGQLSGTNVPSTPMPSDVRAAYNRLKEFVERNECDDDDDDEDDDDEDEICKTDIKNWFGSHAQSWTDVNGSAAGNFTINGGTATSTHTYTQAEANTVYNLSLTHKTDAHKVFLLLAAWKLSQSTTSSASINADIATLETWLGNLGKLSATNNPATPMPAHVKAAYEGVKDWIEDHDCD